ncbi:MAG TPA: tetratricopeptide repeat protein [Ignavibacteria bacterium]|nr:tetratricopeptide repeat protein [Ignavibacteria bacterium]
MNLLNKKFINSILLLTFLSFGIYIYGCASAETTTGKLAYQQKDYAKAEVELKKGLQKNANDGEAWYMLGVSQIELGKYSDARLSFEKVRSLSPQYSQDAFSYWALKYNEGINSFNAGTKSLGSKDSVNAARNFRQGLEKFNAAVNILPDSVSTYQLIADSYLYLGQNDSALAIYESIIEKTKSPSDALGIARVLYQSGVISMTAEKYDDAISIFNKIKNLSFLDKKSEYYEVALFNLGLANYKKLESTSDNATMTILSQNMVDNLEPLTMQTENKDLLKDSYQLLVVAYDVLGNDAKRDDAQSKYNALNQ